MLLGKSMPIKLKSPKICKQARKQGYQKKTLLRV